MVKRRSLNFGDASVSISEVQKENLQKRTNELVNEFLDKGDASCVKQIKKLEKERDIVFDMGLDVADHLDKFEDNMEWITALSDIVLEAATNLEEV